MSTKPSNNPWIIAMVRRREDGSEARSYFKEQMFGMPCFGERERAFEFQTKIQALAATKNWRGKFQFERKVQTP